MTTTLDHPAALDCPAWCDRRHLGDDLHLEAGEAPYACHSARVALVEVVDAPTYLPLHGPPAGHLAVEACHATDSPARIVLDGDGHTVELTVDQAHRLAGALLAAASILEPPPDPVDAAGYAVDHWDELAALPAAERLAQLERRVWRKR